MATDYGTDFDVVEELPSSSAALISGRPNLINALLRRLTTRRGTMRLYDDPNYGYDLREELNNKGTSAELYRIGVEAAAECEKDERVLSATADVISQDLDSIEVEISIVDDVGPFTLVLLATQVTVELLRVT